MSFDLAKAGWMHRQSSFLKIWKRAWFVLSTDGMLRYFDSPDQHRAEGAIRLSTDCIRIKGGPHVKDVSPPTGRHHNCLLEIELVDKTWRLCAECEDDSRAWYITLEDARVINRNQPPPATPPAYTTTVYPQQTAAYGYPGQTMYGSQPPPVVVQHAVPGQPIQAGNTTIIYEDCSHGGCHGRRCCHNNGSDFIMGAAIGSMMMYPYMWW